VNTATDTVTITLDMPVSTIDGVYSDLQDITQVIQSTVGNHTDVTSFTAGVIGVAVGDIYAIAGNSAAFDSPVNNFVGPVTAP
jgi:hypothetical protein